MLNDKFVTFDSIMTSEYDQILIQGKKQKQCRKTLNI